MIYGNMFLRREPERMQTEKALQDFRFLSNGKPSAYVVVSLGS